MSKIPEVIDLDAQTARLTFMFRGSMDFERIRGKCGGEFLSTTDKVMQTEDGSKKAPSAGVEDLKKFFTSFANVRNKIAQLERDGFTLAANEVRKALTIPGYRMIGEIEPFEATTPVTLMMFHPEVTLQVLARMHTAKPHWCSINDIPQGLHVPFHRKSGEVIFYDELLRALRELNAPMREKLKPQRPRDYIEGRSDLNSSVILPNILEDQQTKICSGAFAISFNAEKSKVLRMFTKAEQKQIAVWQFNLPKARSDIHFGLHLEAENNYWQNKRKPFCSTNTYHGYGAIVYPGEAYSCFDEHSKKFKGTRILLY